MSRHPMVLRLALVCLAGSILPAGASAQPTEAGTRLWLGLGVAGGWIPGADGGSGGVIVKFAGQRHPHQLGVRAIILGDLSGSNGGDVGELGLLYGRTSLRSFGHFSVSSGLALVGVGTADVRYTLGLPLSAELGLGEVVAGAGVQWFGNLNAKSSFFGVALFLRLGKLS